ncbi:MAG: T9SS type A sorting domain-containing protein [candidate division WOR-3 bacterium]|nr:MAG: T9SS type A sorting domain-containing protein [candidate division WOR-3 bacterium]
MKASVMLLSLMLIAGMAAASAGGMPTQTPGMLQAVPSNGGEPYGKLEWTYNPEETLHYDGANSNGIGLTGGGTYRGAVRFTPTMSCTVKSILFYQRDVSADDYVFIFAEGNDTTPGAVVDSAPYTGSGGMRWKRIDMPNPIVVTAGTDFWAAVKITHAADSFPLGTDAGPMIRDRGGFLSSSGGRWQQLEDQGLDYNWNVRAIIEPGAGLDHDVGVARILAPGQSINPGSYPPRVRVTNFGTNSENDFDVTCWIDSSGSRVYDETYTVTTALPPGNRTEVTFPDWNTGPSGAMYEMKAFTELATDQDRTNDSMMQGIAIMTGQALVDHDTGYCLLTVTAFGSIGFDQPPADAGNGFKYPKAASNSMFLASFVMGNSPEYVADRWFGQPANGPINDDLYPVESLMPVFPPDFGDEHYRSKFDDSGHPSPKGLVVTQNSYMTADAQYDDFVVIAYQIDNPTGEPVNDMYAGIVSDFDVLPDARQNRMASDTVKRLTYMRSQVTPNPTVGIKILEPPSFANLSGIDHAVWVYPQDSCVTDAQKFRFMNGSIVQRSSHQPYDWSVMNSVGPFDLPAGGSFTLALAIFGGASEAEAVANADAAQQWYRQVGLAEGTKSRRTRDRAFRVVPNPFSNGTWVHYSSRSKGRLEIEVFDAAGRTVDSRSTGIEAGAGRYLWQPSELAHGIYFINIKTPDQETVTKVLRLE